MGNGGMGGGGTGGGMGGGGMVGGGMGGGFGGGRDILMLLPSPSSFARAIATLALWAAICLFSGCSTWTKSKFFDLKSLGWSTHRANTSADVKVKPLSNNEQRKLCLATAEQLAQSQHWSEAAKLYLKAESLGKPGQPLDRELAPVLAANGQFQESIERYQRLLDKNPNDGELEINFAWTLMESGKTPESEQHLRKVLGRDPNNGTARMNLATLLAKTGRNAEAFDMFQSVVGESAAHHNIGVIMLDLGESDLAKQAFANAAACGDCSLQSQQFLAALSNGGADASQLR